MKRYNTKCNNCIKIHRYTWANGCFICTGLVKHPYRECDVCRICDKTDTGKTTAFDLAPDEVGVYTNAYSKLLQTWLTASYRRPCVPKCVEFKNCEKQRKKK